MNRCTSVALGAGLLILACSISNAQSILSDPTFNSPLLTSPALTLPGALAFAPSPTDTLNADAENSIQNDDLTTAPDAPSLAQSPTTIPTQLNQLTFSPDGNSQPPPANKSTEMLWNSAIAASPTFNTTDTSLANAGWQILNGDITATSTATDPTSDAAVASPQPPALHEILIPDPFAISILAGGIAILAWRKPFRLLKPK